jgi:hypothetical protein
MGNDQFEVLSPWAEADPIPARGISPRVTDLNGKKIGIFRNAKRAAGPMSEYLEKKLKAKYPEAEILTFFSPGANELIVDSPAKGAFEEWVKKVDTVVALVGD